MKVIIIKAVIANNLFKTYKNGKKAVNGVSFTIDQGQVFGFLGPNGAGKTTIVKLLNGMLSPTDGKCTIFDMDPSSQPINIHKISGVLTEHAQMYEYMTGLENLIFYATAFGINNVDAKKRAIELLEKLELVQAKDRKLETYSTGMRQRLSLARAMIHHPKILFLDEPTSGLDPESVLSVNNLIKSLADEQNVTIFLCTHQLRYAQEICDFYGLMSDGNLLATGNIEKLRTLVSSGLTVTLRADKMPKGIEYIKVQDNIYTFDINVSSEKDIPYIIKKIVEQNGNIYSVITKETTLEDIYLNLVNKNLGGGV